MRLATFGSVAIIMVGIYSAFCECVRLQRESEICDRYDSMQRSINIASEKSWRGRDEKTKQFLLNCSRLCK